MLAYLPPASRRVFGAVGHASDDLPYGAHRVESALVAVADVHTQHGVNVAKDWVDFVARPDGKLVVDGLPLRCAREMLAVALVLTASTLVHFGCATGMGSR